MMVVLRIITATLVSHSELLLLLLLLPLVNVGRKVDRAKYNEQCRQASAKTSDSFIQIR